MPEVEEIALKYNLETRDGFDDAMKEMGKISEGQLQQFLVMEPQTARFKRRESAFEKGIPPGQIT